MAAPVSLIVASEFAMMNVPRATPTMMTNSHGWNITARWPPIAAKPPSMQPSATIRPIMNAKALPHAADALRKSLNGRPCFKLNFKPPIR